MEKNLTQNDMLRILDTLYEKAINGIPRVSPPIACLAEDYLGKNHDVDTAAKSFIHYQIAKCTTSGFLTGFGGLITLPISIPANISSVLYVQMRMIACLAHMGGYDTKSDQVQTLVYACLAGISVDNILKDFGVKFGVKFAGAMVQKIPGKVLIKINQKVGFRMITKGGTKGLINLGKSVPVVGAFIGGGFDLVETKILGARAYKMFLKNDFSSSKEDDMDVINISDLE